MKTNTSGMKTCLVNLQRVSLAVSRITFPTIPFLCLRGRSCVSCTGPKGSSGHVYSGGSERPPVQLPLPAALRGSPSLFLRLLQPGTEALLRPACWAAAGTRPTLLRPLWGPMVPMLADLTSIFQSCQSWDLDSGEQSGPCGGFFSLHHS